MKADEVTRGHVYADANLLYMFMRHHEQHHIHLISVETDDIFKMLDNGQHYALMPRDARHLAIMQRLGLQEIVSDDADFDRVSELQRHWVLNAPSLPN